jgi:hypothetical protein
MILHEHKEDFQELINIASRELNIEEIYVEKDYFVVLALKTLSKSEHKKNGIFKGGTSLSKAYNLIKRFSEDIDMAAVSNDGKGAGPRPMVVKIEKALTSHEIFTEDKGHIRAKKRSNLRQTVHDYPRIIEEGDNGFGQIEPHVFIDVSRISPGLPFEERPITSYIHDYLLQTDQLKVIKEFELEPIYVNTLCIERTFIEKFGVVVKYASQAEGSQQPIDRLKKGIRHIYDLHLLLQNKRIQDFISGEHTIDQLDFNHFLVRVLNDDLEGMRGTESYEDYMNGNFAESLLYSNIKEVWKELKPTYEGDFKRMLFKNPPPPTSEEIIKSLEQLKSLCEQFDKFKAKYQITFKQEN